MPQALTAFPQQLLKPLHLQPATRVEDVQGGGGGGGGEGGGL